MKGFQSYTVDGEPILDIHAWAREHGQRMVHYLRKVRVVTERGIFWEPDEGHMPENWWANRRIDGPERDLKTEIYEP